jgi:hypothetical protein
MIAYQSTVLMHCKSENMSHRRRIAETITATAVALSANVRQGPIPPGDQRCVPGLFSPNIRMFMVSTKVIVLALCVLEVALGVFHVQADHDGSGPSGSVLCNTNSGIIVVSGAVPFQTLHASPFVAQISAFRMEDRDDSDAAAGEDDGEQEEPNQVLETPLSEMSQDHVEQGSQRGLRASSVPALPVEGFENMGSQEVRNPSVQGEDNLNREQPLHKVLREDEAERNRTLRDVYEAG